jgi:hypothetical protein
MGNTHVQKKRNIDFRYILNSIRNNYFLNKSDTEIRTDFCKLGDIILNRTENMFFFDFDSRRPPEWDLEFILAIHSNINTDIDIYLDDVFLSRQRLVANNYNALVCNPIPIYFYQMYNSNNLIRFKIHIQADDIPDDVNMKILVCNTCPESIQKYPYIQSMKSQMFSAEEKKMKNIFYNNKPVNRIVICDEDEKDALDETHFFFQEIPCFYHFTESYREYLAKKTCDLIRDDLLEITMHPDRLEYFLSNDLKKKFNIKLS